MTEKYLIVGGSESTIVYKYDQVRQRLIIGGHKRFRDLIERVLEMIGFEGDPIYYSRNKVKFVFDGVKYRKHSSILNLIKENLYCEQVFKHGRLI